MQSTPYSQSAREPFYRLPETAYQELQDMHRFVELLALLAQERGATDTDANFRLALPPEALSHCLRVIASGMSEPLASAEWTGTSVH